MNIQPLIKMNIYTKVIDMLYINNLKCQKDNKQHLNQFWTFFAMHINLMWHEGMAQNMISSDDP